MNSSQKRVLQTMGFEAESLPEEVVRSFFDYTDQGIKPPEMSREFKSVFDNLLRRHRDKSESLEGGIRKELAEGFREGTVFPQEFDDDTEEMRTRAKKVFIKEYGFLTLAWDKQRRELYEGKVAELSAQFREGKLSVGDCLKAKEDMGNKLREELWQEQWPLENGKWYGL